MKTNTKIWSIALLIISIVTIIYTSSNIAGIKLPDILIRILGIMDIIAIPVLIFTSVRKFKK